MQVQQNKSLRIYSSSRVLLLSNSLYWYYPGQKKKKKKKKKKTATTIMHKIRTLFLSWDIEKSSLIGLWCSDARSRGKPRHRASLVILRDKNSVVILCTIVVAVFFFFFLARVVHVVCMQHATRYSQHSTSARAKFSSWISCSRIISDWPFQKKTNWLCWRRYLSLPTSQCSAARRTMWDVWRCFSLYFVCCPYLSTSPVPFFTIFCLYLRSILCPL